MSGTNRTNPRVHLKDKEESERLRDNKYIFFGNVLQFDARYRDPSPNWGVIGLKLMTVTKKHQGGESRTRDGEFQELAAGSVISYKSQNVLQF